MKIRLTLIVALLAFGIQGISYSQLFNTSEESEWTPPEKLLFSFDDLTTEDVTPELTIDEIRDKTIPSLVWITTTESQGSGVLIDEKLRLVVTNHHVTKDSKSVWVFFPVRDKDRNWIEERDFYTNLDNLALLKRLGYAILGRVVATDSKTDLALIQLGGLPDTAREIEHNLSKSYHAQMDKNDRVRIFGNPEGRSLWTYTPGFFITVNNRMIEIETRIHEGNSGGPVINDEGILIGIATLSNKRYKAWAVPATSIGEVLGTLQPRQIFTITNNTPLSVKYQSKWSEGDMGNTIVLAPDKVMNHSYPGPSGDIAEGYPKITFDNIIGDREDAQSVVFDLQTYTRHFGSEVEPDDQWDGYAYHFSYNSDTKKLDLYQGFPTQTASSATRRSWLAILLGGSLGILIVIGAHIVIPKVKFRIREWRIKR